MTIPHNLKIENGRVSFITPSGTPCFIPLDTQTNDANAIRLAESGAYVDDFKASSGTVDVSATVYCVIGEPGDGDGLFAVVITTSDCGVDRGAEVYFVTDAADAEDIARDCTESGWDGRC